MDTDRINDARQTLGPIVQSLQEEQPDHFLGWYAQAMMVDSLKEQAVLLSKAIELNPNFGPAYIKRASALSMSDPVKAKADVERAKELGERPSPALLQGLGIQE